MYISLEGEYEELLARGATRLIYETIWHRYIFDELAGEGEGEGTKKGYRWKTRLCRSQIDEEDPDGSQLIKGFTLSFSLSISNRVAEQWETVEVTSGVWETRLMLDLDDQHVLGDADSDNGYEEEDDSQIAEDLYDPDAFPGLVDIWETYQRTMRQEDLRWGLSMTRILRFIGPNPFLKFSPLDYTTLASHEGYQDDLNLDISS
ncbi:hypothetical protein PLEOSDRAFT_1102640 [Pleurotus ostreatus PC15]|uniref:Uncharacterized protein n=1 Tax=Pleurotus ostreatus (strain PC15) TaxID=1137138 RepID=A0A067NKI9_PLEO1|nr:hypothetical protein PLEOSDRAFT_1102640 [Pleurotus ostreatus PC15]